MDRIFGALEAGGTKMICAIGDAEGRILERAQFPTGTPADTMPMLTGFFKDRGIEALGVGCFGPVDVNPSSPTWGCILDTPKLAWRGFDIVSALREAADVPVGFDTDVNGSLLGEVTFGNAGSLTDVIYITIGTGIGAGIMTNGRLLHGMLHPEAGHMRLQVLKGDTYGGRCPYHGSCFEGLASGPAIKERWGRPGIELSDRREVWEMEAAYIAQAITNLTMALSPQRFILGGGVMHQKQLFDMIRDRVREYIGGYIRTKELENLKEYIVPASLGDDQGILGALKLAMDAVV